MNPLGTLKLVERSSPGDWILSLLSDCHVSSYSHLPLLLAPSQRLWQGAVLLQAAKLHKWDPSLGRGYSLCGSFWGGGGAVHHRNQVYHKISI